MVEDLFLKLVRISSPSGEEAEVRLFAQSELMRLGFETFVDKTGNLIARNYSSSQPVLLSAHLDTVMPGIMVKPHITNKIIKSGGDTVLGADNKASVAAIISAIKTTPASSRKSIEIIFSVREETDGGINYFDFSQVKSKLGICSDSGEVIGTIVDSSPWIDDFEVEVIGKPAHSSVPDEGVNALSCATEALQNLRWGKVDKLTIANVGLISGGSATNTIPGIVRIKGEIRSFSENRYNITKQKIGNVFQDKAKKYGARINVKYNFYCRGYNLSKRSNNVLKILNIFNTLNIRTVFKPSFGASDANVYRAHGIDILNLGDGVVDPHTNRESISVQSLVELAEIYRNYISI